MILTAWVTPTKRGRTQDRLVSDGRQRSSPAVLNFDPNASYRRSQKFARFWAISALSLFITAITGFSRRQCKTMPWSKPGPA